jgi:hypothetical protein
VRGLLVLLAVLLGATACGGSKASDYRGQVNDVRQRYEPRFDQITTRIQDDVGASALHKMGVDASAGAALMTRYANDVARIEPPSDLRPQAEKLVAAYREWARALRELAQASRTRAAATVRTALRAFNHAARQEHAAVEALNAAG